MVREHISVVLVHPVSSRRKLIQRRTRGGNYSGNVGQPSVAAPLPAKDKVRYLAGILPPLRAPSTQHVPGDHWHNMVAFIPFDQLEVDFPQL